jgi:transcriptional regulator with XRE-family HTH domain
MNLNTLQSLLKIRGWTPSQLAKEAGISRQVVSLWSSRARIQGFEDINVFSKNQKRVATALNVKPQTLDMALISEKNKEDLKTELLWDHLYPNLETFSAAIVKGQPDAVARLVQVYGLVASARMVGKKIWKTFPLYKKKLHPAYRKEAEIIWKYCQS